MLTFFQGRQKVSAAWALTLPDSFSIGMRPAPFEAEFFPGWAVPRTWVIHPEFSVSPAGPQIFLASVLHGYKKPSPGQAENMLVQKHLTISQHMETQAVSA